MAIVACIAAMGRSNVRRFKKINNRVVDKLQTLPKLCNMLPILRGYFDGINFFGND